MTESIQQNDQYKEWKIVNIQKVDQFPEWIIAKEREEGTLAALNYKVDVHFNQIF